MLSEVSALSEVSLLSVVELSVEVCALFFCESVSPFSPSGFCAMVFIASAAPETLPERATSSAVSGTKCILPSSSQYSLPMSEGESRSDMTVCAKRMR